MSGVHEDTTSVDSQQRKIVKPKRKLAKDEQKVIIEDDGEEIELGSEQEYEEEDVVQRSDEEWEDVDSGSE